jgi:hypothetical protein
MPTHFTFAGPRMAWCAAAAHHTIPCRHSCRRVWYGVLLRHTLLNMARAGGHAPARRRVPMAACRAHCGPSRGARSYSNKGARVSIHGAPRGRASCVHGRPHRLEAAHLSEPVVPRLAQQRVHQDQVHLSAQPHRACGPPPPLSVKSTPMGLPASTMGLPHRLAGHHVTIGLPATTSPPSLGLTSVHHLTGASARPTPAMPCDAPIAAAAAVAVAVADAVAVAVCLLRRPPARPRHHTSITELLVPASIPALHACSIQAPRDPPRLSVPPGRPRLRSAALALPNHGSKRDGRRRHDGTAATKHGGKTC